MWPWRKKQDPDPYAALKHMWPSIHPVKNVGGEVVPDEISTEPLRGYRYWNVVNDGDGLALKSLHADYLWAETNTAQCWRGMTNRTPHEGKSPHPECACGFYAEHPDYPLREWQNQTLAKVSAHGTILMSGRIIVCEMGYKAEHVEIESPIFVSANCQVNCGNPPSKVTLPNVHQSYPTWCDEHAPNMELATVDVDIWLRHAVDDLSARYPNTEFFSSAQLGD